MRGWQVLEILVCTAWMNVDRGEACSGFYPVPSTSSLTPTRADELGGAEIASTHRDDSEALDSVLRLDHTVGNYWG